MAQLPAAYAWLATIGVLPKMVQVAISLLDTRERVGSGNNPVIMDWARELGGDLARDYIADSIPWCGLFMAFVARKAGKTPVAKPLWALNWGNFGEPGGQPELGDVLTFIRPEGGHVGLYVGEDDGNYHILGGNQGDTVGFTPIDKTRLRAVRQPHYMVRPATVKPYRVNASGSQTATLQ